MHDSNHIIIVDVNVQILYCNLCALTFILLFRTFRYGVQMIIL